MNKNNYMTTGEFAKAMGVTKDTLFHYDSIGLFSPELVMENEYRYYSIYQMEVFDTILLLKDMGMSLMEIKEFMKRRSAEEFLAVYDLREKQIDDQIKKLKAQKRRLNEQKKCIEEVQKLDLNKIYRKHCPKRYYMYVPIEDNTDAEIYRKTNQIIVDYERKNVGFAFDIAYVQRGEDVWNEIYDNYRSILLITSKKPIGVKFSVLEEGEYLAAYHTGDWSNVKAGYQRLLDYAAEHHLNLDDFFLERYVVDSLLAENVEEYVTEILVRIV